MKCDGGSSSFTIMICCRNKENVEGSTHRQVVELIKAGGDRLILCVVSVHPMDADRLDPGTSDDNGSPFSIDYSEKRSLPITVPSWQWVSKDGDRHVVRAYNFWAQYKTSAAKIRAINVPRNQGFLSVDLIWPDRFSVGLFQSIGTILKKRFWF